MRAAVLEAPGQPLRIERRPIPEPGPGEVLVHLAACGVCRTDLHLLAGEVPGATYPRVPGHEGVGTVVRGEGHPVGTRVGIPWLGFACGRCERCVAGEENLCPWARFNGSTRDGAFAEYVAVDARFCFPLPASFSDLEAAPLLCAGLIGYRALRLAGNGKRVGLYGFGAAAHLIAQVLRWQQREVFAFTRPADREAQDFARALGATWAGGSDTPAPVPLDAAILFAPVGELVPLALGGVRPGGTVVCAGIHMTDIPRFPYALLWGERVLRSVANLTRGDAEEFLALAPKVGLHPVTRAYPLAQVNQALADFRRGALLGAAVVVP